jgi:hypothetical protein
MSPVRQYVLLNPTPGFVFAYVSRNYFDGQAMDRDYQYNRMRHVFYVLLPPIEDGVALPVDRWLAKVGMIIKHVPRSMTAGEGVGHYLVRHSIHDRCARSHIPLSNCAIDHYLSEHPS